MSKKESNANEALDLTNRPPTAGEQRDIPLGQALFFSPLPLPTVEVLGLGFNCNFLEVNDVYLDIGNSNNGQKVLVQMAIFCLSSFFLLCIFMVLAFIYIAGIHDSNVHSYGFYVQQIWQDEAIDTMLFIFSGIFLISAYTIIKTTYQNSRQRPIRFNRQRREVCYFPLGSDSPVMCPWEELITWIASDTPNGLLDKLTNNYAMNRYGLTNISTTYTFGMAIEDKKNDRYWFIIRPQAAPLAQGEWEAIRCFMEKGPQACPAKTEHIDRHSFDNKRAELHHRFKHGPKYWFNFSMIEWSTSYFGVAWFYIWNVMCWWKFPYYVAEWDQKFSMKEMPANIEAWSSALPEDEWAKPSEELIEQTQKMEAHLARGGLFYDFFATNTQADADKKRA